MKKEEYYTIIDDHQEYISNAMFDLYPEYSAVRARPYREINLDKFNFGNDAIQEDLIIINDLINKISFGEKEKLFMNFILKGYSAKEIAFIMNNSVQEIYRKIHICTTKIKKAWN